MRSFRAHAREKGGISLGESIGRCHGERLLRKTHVRRTLRFTRRKDRERGKAGNVWKSCLPLTAGPSQIFTRANRESLSPGAALGGMLLSWIALVRDGVSVR